MQISDKNSHSLRSAEDYMEAVLSHVDRLTFQLQPLISSQAEATPSNLCDGARPPMSSTFGLNLVMCLRYLRGEANVPAEELPDLLQAVYDVVHGVEGCGDLERAVLTEHQRIARLPLEDVQQPSA